MVKETHVLTSLKAGKAEVPDCGYNCPDIKHNVK